jgi:hypothetical protein
MLLSLNTKTHKTFSVAVTKYAISSRAVMYQSLNLISMRDEGTEGEWKGGGGGTLASKDHASFL